MTNGSAIVAERGFSSPSQRRIKQSGLLLNHTPFLEALEPGTDHDNMTLDIDIAEAAWRAAERKMLTWDRKVRVPEHRFRQAFEVAFSATLKENPHKILQIILDEWDRQAVPWTQNKWNIAVAIRKLTANSPHEEENLMQGLDGSLTYDTD